MRLIFSLTSILIFLTSCQTPEQRLSRQFKAVELGMTKSQVLEVAGPPHWSDHNKGLDRWFYYMEPEARQSEQIVFFKQGKVSGKGQREKPTFTAEEEEQIKAPRPPKVDFKPTYTEKQMRALIKKEIEKKEGKKKKAKKSKLERL